MEEGVRYVPELTLSALGAGCEARVVRLLTAGAMRRRLLDIGLMPGETVRCLFSARSGDPTAYWIRGAVIALRKEDANTVVVVPHPEQTT